MCTIGTYEPEDPKKSSHYLYFSFMVILSSILDAISHTIKEALVRTQPLNQEQFNFKISVFQLIIGLILLPMIKLTQPDKSSDTESPFKESRFYEMNWIEYMADYVGYGLGCVFDTIDKDHHKFNNHGQCESAWFFIIGYTLSLFLI
jgi:hypothetical protein